MVKYTLKINKKYVYSLKRRREYGKHTDTNTKANMTAAKYTRKYKHNSKMRLTLNLNCSRRPAVGVAVDVGRTDSSRLPMGGRERERRKGGWNGRQCQMQLANELRRILNIERRGSGGGKGGEGAASPATATTITLV